MKNLITALLISRVCLSSFGQTTTKNYVKSYTARQAISSTLAGNNNKLQTQQSIQYLDGLGRPEQSIQRWASPSSKDMIVPYSYDEYGRSVKSYLPYESAANNTNFRSSALTEQNSFYGGDYPYSEQVLEGSPLSRVFEQGSPGSTWRVGQNTVEYTYETNGASEVILWEHDDIQLAAQTNYSANQLYKNSVEDEDGNVTISYTDAVGKTVLKKSEVGSSWADTYYIYDEYDRLKYVLPPQANVEIGTFYDGLVVDGFTVHGNNYNVNGAGSNGKHAYTFETTITIPAGVTLTPGFQAKPITVLTPDFLAQWAFQYSYDDRDRMISKQVPGADPVFMVYDDYDRLVLTQDGNQRANNEWLFTKYDNLNRPIMTGIQVISGSLTTIRSNAAASSHHETWTGTGTTQYSNNTYPTTNGSTEFLTVTYYDDHTYQSHADWSTPSLSFFNPGSLTESTSVKGQITGTMTYAENGTWIRTRMYYDDKYRLIQTQSSNHLGGKDIVSNYYDFIGQLDKTITSHSDATATTVITRTFEYDHVGRLLNTYHQIGNNTSDKKLIASNSYNARGELVEKDLHSEDNGSTFEQSVDYAYNIRGWLTGINNSALSGGDGDLFGMELFYNTSAGLSGQSTVFNGNISAVKWSDQDMSALGVSARGYTYAYDKLNRLTAANHFENGSGTNKFGVSGLTYDLNGNIQSLKRRSTSTSNYMDNLTYAYSGNQLTKVDDSGDDSEGFTETTTGTDYAYDSNGNMISDKNKGITDIDYNHLNLPTEVTMNGSGNRIEYLYDAAGIKLQQKVFESNTLTKTTDYVGEFIYETLGSGNRKLQLIQHEEGRIIYEDFGHDWDYQYHLKDHLGNTRLTFSTLSQDPLVCVETFETGEDNGFQDLHRHTNSNANTTVGGNEVERLLSGQTGAMAFIGVNKNDVVSLSVQANYETAPSGNSFVEIADNVLFGSFDGVYGTIEGGGFTTTTNEFEDAITGAGMADKGDSNGDPRAFLNFIFFDLDMNYVNASFEQVSTAALGTGNHELVEINNYVPDRDGYILAYLSNENSQALTMHFDDFTITQVKTNIVQADDYYPFGLTFNSYSRTASTPQNFKYNGFEEMTDLGLNLYDYLARHYDPAIGRFIQVDPAADFMRRHSPYNYAFDNPIRYIDPDGMFPDDVVEDEGTTARTITSAGNTDFITETSSQTNVTSQTVDASDADYQQALSESGIDPSNLSGQAIVTQSTTTTNSSVTVLEFDDSGNQISENTTSSTLVETKTNVTFVDSKGGDGGGAVINKGANISFDTDAAASSAVSAKVKDAVNYRAGNGVSVTNRNDFAGAAARQKNAADYVSAGSALGGLGAFKYATLPSLAFGVATSGIGASLNRGVQNLENRSKGCNNCTKKF